MRCADCGYLERWNPHQQRIVSPARGQRVADGRLRCFRDVPDFNPQAVDHAWDCPAFIEWEPGLTAMEHAQMNEIRAAQDRQWRLQRWNLVFLGVVAATSIGAMVVGIVNLVY